MNIAGTEFKELIFIDENTNELLAYITADGQIIEQDGFKVITVPADGSNDYGFEEAGGDKLVCVPLNSNPDYSKQNDRD